MSDELYSMEDLIQVTDLMELHPENFSQSWKENRHVEFNDLLNALEDCHITHQPGGRLHAKNVNIIPLFNIQDDLELLQQRSKWLRSDISYPELNLIAINHAFSFPGSYFKYKIGPYEFPIGEVWDKDDNVLVESLIRTNGYCLKPESQKRLRSEATFQAGTYLYLGQAMNHYGDFIMDSLSYVWPCLAYKEELRDVIPVFDLGDTKIRRWWKKIRFSHHFMNYCYDKLGVDLKKAIILDKPSIFEHLLVPIRSNMHYGKKKYIHPFHANVYAKITEGIDASPENLIFLSRRKFNKKKRRRTLENEKEMEQLFKSHGFSIVYPEKKSFENQLKMLLNARTIAGTYGSNMLNCAFISGEKTLLIYPWSKINKDAILLNAINDNITIMLLTHHKDIDNYSSATWQVDLEILQKTLHEQGFAYTGTKRD